LTGWQELDDPLLHVDELDVVAWADHTSLVDAGGMSEIIHVSIETDDAYRPLSWMTILPLRWSSTSSNSPM
jgi:hypothetical protein